MILDRAGMVERSEVLLNQLLQSTSTERGDWKERLHRVFPTMI
jgi:hypothetical protein